MFASERSLKKKKEKEIYAWRLNGFLRLMVYIPHPHPALSTPPLCVFGTGLPERAIMSVVLVCLFCAVQRVQLNTVAVLLLRVSFWGRNLVILTGPPHPEKEYSKTESGG